MKKTITRRELSDKFADGIQRKMQEKELFTMLSVEHPDKKQLYDELCNYLDYEVRYYNVCRAYYADDFESLTSEDDNNLLFLTGESEVSPRVYAQYLREIPADVRDDERMTHTALRDMKKAMAQAVMRS